MRFVRREVSAAAADRNDLAAALDQQRKRESQVRTMSHAHRCTTAYTTEPSAICVRICILCSNAALLTRVSLRDYCGASQLAALLEQAHARIAHVEAQCAEAAHAKAQMETTAAALACEADRLSQEVSSATRR